MADRTKAFRMSDLACTEQTGDVVEGPAGIGGAAPDIFIKRVMDSGIRQAKPVSSI
jgi:hypothetical protein